MNNNTPLTEIGLLVVSVALLAAMTVLLVTGKINYIEALNFLVVVAGLFGVNVAAKAPSPAQQENLQQLISLVAARLQPAPTPSSQPVPQPIQLAPGALNTTTSVHPMPAQTSQLQFAPSPLAAIQPTGQMPAVVPPETK